MFGRMPDAKDNEAESDMSEIIDAAVTALNEKLSGAGFDGSAKFEIEGEGAVRIDEDGASASDAEADVTLTANAETFQAILSGEQNATAAFMTGKLSVDGDMGMAMKLGSVMSNGFDFHGPNRIH